jgi:hypothetical protein
MDQYIIRNNNRVNRLLLDQISVNMHINAEIFGLDSGREVFIGIVNEKAISYIAIEFARNYISNVCGLEITPNVKYAFDLCDDWIKDSDSVEKEVLRTAVQNLYEYVRGPSSVYGAAYIAAKILFDSYVLKIQRNNILKSFDIEKSLDIEINISMSFRGLSHFCTANPAVVKAKICDKERVRLADTNFSERSLFWQGQFIVDFFKSGKHLFLV